MINFLILGSGVGGTIVANTLRGELDESELWINIIDKDNQHHFQSGYLFIPFGVYSKDENSRLRTQIQILMLLLDLRLLFSPLSHIRLR